MKENYDVVLIFPPQWSPLQPYLSVPALSAYLKENDVDVSQHDLSIEFYDTLLSREQLLPMCQKLEQVYERLGKMPFLSADEQLFFYSIFLVRPAFGEVLDLIEDTKDFFRSDRFFNLEELNFCKSILNTAFNIINVYSGACLSLSDLEFPLDVASLGAITRFITDRKDTFFIRFFERQVHEVFSTETCAVAGLSVNNPSQIVPALTMARWLRTHHPEIHVTLGGNLLTRWSENLKFCPDFFQSYANSVVLFEGESPLLALVKAVKESRPLASVPNLMYMNRGIVATEICAPEDINLLPTPDFAGLPLGKYFSPHLILPLLTSRGCYWGKCTFCDHSVIYRGRFRQREARLVTKDLENMKSRYGTRYFSFADEGTSPAACRKVSQEIIEQGLDVALMTQVRMEAAFTEETCQLMARAGMKMVFMGLESACDRILAKIEKGIDIRRGAEIVQRFHNAGIMVHLFVLFGFPGETAEEANETFQFILNNKDHIFSAGASTLGVGKYSPIGLNPTRYDIKLVSLDGEKTLAYIYDFEYSSGQSPQSVAELRDSFMRMVRTDLKFGAIWGFMFREQFFLYALQYTENELLQIAQQYQDIKTHLHAPVSVAGSISPDVHPCLKRGVYLEKIPFDISRIQEGLDMRLGESVEQGTIFLVYSMLAQEHAKLTRDGYAVLALCDGNHSIKEIVNELSQQYEAEPDDIEERVISFLCQPTVGIYVRTVLGSEMVERKTTDFSNVSPDRKTH